MSERPGSSAGQRRAAFEQQLREAVRAPVALPEGFAERVLARARGQRRGVPGRVRLHWAAVAAAVLVVVMLAGAGVWQARRAQQQEAQARAQQQLRFAMRITSARLEAALARGINAPLAEARQKIEEAQR